MLAHLLAISKSPPVTPPNSIRSSLRSLPPIIKRSSLRSHPLVRIAAFFACPHPQLLCLPASWPLARAILLPPPHPIRSLLRSLPLSETQLTSLAPPSQNRSSLRSPPPSIAMLAYQLAISKSPTLTPLIPFAARFARSPYQKRSSLRSHPLLRIAAPYARPHPQLLCLHVS